MHLFVAGLSHQTAPIALRERFALSPEAVPAALDRLRANGGCAEGMLLSTCNRFEIYGRLDDGRGPVAAAPLLRRLAQAGVDVEALAPHVYARQGDDALEHLFRVTSGLESMILGEPQIAGQVSAAYDVARTVGSAGPLIHRAVPRAIQVGRRVRNETTICQGVASVAGAAVTLAKRVFRNLDSASLLTIGAGDTVRTALAALRKTAHGPLVVTNRSVERAETLADEFGGQADGLEGLARRAAEADVVVTATGASEPLLLADELLPLLKGRRRRPLLILDLGVPRDVDPAVGEHEGVFLYAVDDLNSIADGGRQARLAQVPKAEAIIRGALVDFRRRRKGLDADPAIRGLLDGLLGLRRDLVAGEKGLTKEERKVADRVTGKFVDRLLRRLAPRVKEGKAGANEVLEAFGITPPTNED